MKRITTIASVFMLVCAALLTIHGCKKETATKTMTIAELKAEKGLDLIALWDAAYGDNGTARSNPNRPERPKANQQITVEYLLTASVSGGVLTGTVSLDAYVAGGQKFGDTTSNDGATGLWGCNRSYTAPNTTQNLGISCSTDGSGGWCRVFSADFVTYAVKLSKFVSNN